MKKVMARVVSLIFVFELLLGNFNIVSAYAADFPENSDDLSTVYFSDNTNDLYGIKKAVWIDSEKEAEISFELTAKPALQSTTTFNPVEVYLIIDDSDSMNDTVPDATGANISKKVKVRKEVTDFVKQSLIDYAGKIKFSIVMFGDNAKDCLPAETSGLSNDENILIPAINTYDDYNGDKQGTNIEAALMKTRSIVENNMNGVQKIVILLSDGKPTYSYASESYNSITNEIYCGRPEDIVGNGEKFVMSMYNTDIYRLYYIFDVNAPSDRTKDIAVQDHGVTTMARAYWLKKDLGVTIVTIGYGVPAGGDEETVLSGIASQTGFYENTDSTANPFLNVASILKGIINPVITDQITYPTNVVMTDVIPEYFDLDTTSLPADVTYDPITRKLTWNMGDLVMTSMSDTVKKSMKIRAYLNKDILNKNVVKQNHNYIESNTSCEINYDDNQGVKKAIVTQIKDGTTWTINNPWLPITWPSPTPTPKPTATPTPKPTATPIPTVTVTPTATPMPTVTVTPTATPMPTVAVTTTTTPTVTPVPTATVTPVPTLIATATPTPITTPTLEPTATPTVSLVPSTVPTVPPEATPEIEEVIVAEDDIPEGIPSSDDIESEEQIEEDEEAEAEAEVEAKELPKTGTIPIEIFYICGNAIVISGISVLMKKSRQKRNS